jgi:hypothetical protein
VPKIAPKVALPLAILPVLKLPALGPVPAIPPPPAASFARPIPPGGATVRVFEEKREEEAAPEQSQAFARHRPAGHGVPLAARAGADLRLPMAARAHTAARTGGGRTGGGATYLLLGLVLLMAAGGASIRFDAGRRRRVAVARVAAHSTSPRPRRRT